MLDLDSASVYTDFAGLAKLKNQAREQSPAAIKEVAKQFESVFLNMVLKSMRQAKLAEGMFDSQQSQTYQEMYDQQMSLHLAGKPGGTGLADLIARQLEPKKEPQEGRQDIGDYLNRAVGAVGSSSTLPVGEIDRSGRKATAAAPTLTNLERNLAQMEDKQRQLDGQWAGIERQWAVARSSAESKTQTAAPAQQKFIEQLLPHAQQAARELGVDAHILLAQAALETGWGQSMVKTGRGENTFNLFNIKADKSWQGKQATAVTAEFAGGVAHKESAGFRAYSSYKESFQDYVHFIKSNPRYGHALKMADNAERYMQELQRAGYATDPDYADKVLSIYNSRS